MTDSSGADLDPGTDVADRIAAVVRGVPGVAGLHPGMFGEVGTYLPGRMIPGVRTTGSNAEVHVTVYFDADIRATAARIRRVLAEHFDGDIDVTIEDVVPEPTPPVAPSLTDLKDQP